MYMFGSRLKCRVSSRVYTIWPYLGTPWVVYFSCTSFSSDKSLGTKYFCLFQSSSEFLLFKLQWWINSPLHLLVFCLVSQCSRLCNHSVSLIYHSLFWSWLHYLPFLSWCTGTLQIQLNLLRYYGFWPTHPSFKVERFLILPLISLLSHLSAVSGLMQ